MRLVSLYRWWLRSGLASGLGLGVSALLLDAAVYGGFAVMGVDASEAMTLVRQQYQRQVFELLATLVLVFLSVFMGLGVFARGILFVLRERSSTLRCLYETALIALGCHLLALWHAIIQRPQLFEAAAWRSHLGWTLRWLATGASLAIWWLVVGSLGLALVSRLVWRLWRARPARASSRAMLLAMASGTVVLLGLVGVSLRTPARFLPGAKRPRHIIVVAADSLRSDRLFPEAGSRSPMPFLSGLLAERATGYSRTMVPLARTFPSWITLLSSQLPVEHGVRTMFPTAEERRKTPPMLATILAERGFSTSVYSDFAGDIFPRYAFGFQRVRAPMLSAVTLIQSQAMEASIALLPYLDNAWGKALFPVLRSLANAPDAQLITTELLSDLQHEASRDTFSVLFYSDAHFPYAAPYPGYGRFASPTYAGPNRFQFSPASLLAGSPSEQELGQIRALYDGGLSTIDDQLRRLVTGLEQRGLLDSTLLLVTADHGENLGEYGLGFAHGNHLLGIHSHEVPLAWIDFSQPRPVRRIDRVHRVRTLDMAPTLLELLGLPQQPSFRGRSVAAGVSESLPCLMETGIWFTDIEHSHDLPRDLRIPYPGIEKLVLPNASNHDELELRSSWNRLVPIAKHLGWQVGDERLVYVPLRGGALWQLYDLATDPGSQRDLAEQRPQRVTELREQMLAAMRAAAPVREVGGLLEWGIAPEPIRQDRQEN